MEEFSQSFIKSQDFQFDKIAKILEDAKHFIENYSVEMEELEGNREKEINECKPKLQEMAEGLKEAYKVIDKYQTIIETVSSQVERAEQDLRAIEEYAYGERSSYLGNIVSWFSH